MENVVFFEKTVKLAMKWKQGTRSRGEATEEEGVYEGQKE